MGVEQLDAIRAAFKYPSAQLGKVERLILGLALDGAIFNVIDDGLLRRSTVILASKMACAQKCTTLWQSAYVQDRERDVRSSSAIGCAVFATNVGSVEHCVR